MHVVATTAGIAIALGLALRYFTGAHLAGPIMLVVLVAWPFVGVFITSDDDLPGGFSNPDSKIPPPWKYWENWALLAVGAALSGIGFAIDAGWRTEAAIVPWVAGCLGIAGGLLLNPRLQRKVATHDV